MTFSASKLSFITKRYYVQCAAVDDDDDDDDDKINKNPCSHSRDQDHLDINTITNIVASKHMIVENSLTFQDTEKLSASFDTLCFNHLGDIMLKWLFVLQDVSNKIPSSRFSHARRITHLMFTCKSMHFAVCVDSTAVVEKNKNNIERKSNDSKTNDNNNNNINNDKINVDAVSKKKRPKKLMSRVVCVHFDHLSVTKESSIGLAEASPNTGDANSTSNSVPALRGSNVIMKAKLLDVYSSLHANDITVSDDTLFTSTTSSMSSSSASPASVSVDSNNNTVETNNQLNQNNFGDNICDDTNIDNNGDLNCSRNSNLSDNKCLTEENDDNDVKAIEPSNPNDYILRGQNMEQKGSKGQKKEYTPINSYKPSGNLIYDDELLNKIEDRFL
jgi:hypothetical protein